MSLSNDLRLTIAPSALMHASLAVMSPELLTLNTIIRLRSFGTLKVSSTSTVSIASIPPEILLAIRGHLLPLVTSHLYALTADALTTYETMRSERMCDDCLAYHTHVFGTDTWDWPPNAMCRCREDTSFPSTLPKSPASLAQSRNRKWSPPATRHEWLEFHLSKRAKRILAARHGPRASMGKGIWDLVADVLREFECGVLRDEVNSGELFPARPLPISIVPAPFDNGSSVTSRDAADVAWHSAIALRRIQRELGLLFTEPDVDVLMSAAPHDRGRQASHAKKNTPTVKAQSQSSTQPYVLLSLLALLAIIAFAKGA